jgi:hypothetical protein
MSKYTPGPWALRWHNGYRLLSIYSGANINITVARVNITNIDRDGNAALLAAAPDLLEALRRVLPWAELEDCGGPDIGADLSCARAAIAKATGSVSAACHAAGPDGKKGGAV